MTDHEFVMPFPGAETIRCRNCGAGKGSPVGKKPCVPVKSFMEHRKNLEKPDLLQSAVADLEKKGWL